MTVDLPNGHYVEIRFASHTPSGYSFGEIEIDAKGKGINWSAINGKVSANVDISFNTITSGDIKAFLDLMNEYAENGFPQEVVEELQSYRAKPNEVSEALGISVDTLAEGGEVYSENGGEIGDEAGVALYDEKHGTELGEWLKFVDRGEIAKNKTQFHIAKSGAILNKYGINGDINVSRKAINPKRHTNNSDHELGVQEWIDIVDTINDPIAITRYKGEANSYRIYTMAQINGKNICVGVDVNTTNGVEITKITTAFGRDIRKIENSTTEEELYNKQKATEQISGSDNSHLYAEQPSANKGNNNISENQEDVGILFREGERYSLRTNSQEEADIIAKAKADGTYMKAPNGEPTNLTERQWAQVRTKAFKEWFGDWETSYKKNFLLNGNPVASLTGNEFTRIEGKTLTDQVAEFFESLGGKAKSPLFGDVILDRNGADNSLAHGMGRTKAIAYASVKEVIENGIIVDYHINHKGRGYDSAIVVAPIEIGGERYICSVVIKKSKKDNKFYLHEVTKQKNLQDEVFLANLAQKPTSIGDLAKVLQNIVTSNENASKVVDENGEPMVVYHGTEGDFNVFDRTKGRASMDIQGMFFSPWELDAQGYGRNVRAFYLNIRKPSSGGQSYKALNRYQGQMYAGIKARDYLIGLGYDGVNNYGEEFITFNPNQIKSATDNVGSFSSESDDIRYSLRGGTGNVPVEDLGVRDRAIARDAYERMVASGRYQFTEAMQDSMMGVKLLYKAILGKKYKGIENVAGYENAYIAENAMSSQSAAQQYEYQVRFMKPLLNEVHRLTKGDKAARSALADYMMAKHGLERNVVMAERDAKRVADEAAYIKFKEVRQLCHTSLNLI